MPSSDKITNMLAFASARTLLALRSIDTLRDAFYGLLDHHVGHKSDVKFYWAAHWSRPSIGFP